MKRLLVVATAGLALTLTACGGGEPWKGTSLGESEWKACTKVVAYYNDHGFTPSADLAHDVNATLGQGSVLSDAGQALARTRDNRSAWKMASDGFVSQCMDAGFDPKHPY